MRRTLLIFAALALTAGAGHAAAPAISGSVIGSGATQASGGGLLMNATLGQPAIGLSAVPANGLCAGFWCFGGTRVAAVGGSGPISIAALGPATPTPASGRVSFGVEVPARAPVSLRVFDISGRQVGTLLEGTLDAGRYQVSWENPSGSGRSGGVGVYFARLLVNGREAGVRRVIMIR